MPSDIREYLLDRFRTDATTLRQRAEALRAAAKPSPGPNAELSAAMASACDDVVALAEELPEHAPLNVIVDALKVLVPRLLLMASSPEAVASPAIRSVYVGACTRAQELIAAEANAANTTDRDALSARTADHVGFDEDFTDDDIDDDSDADDEDVDDDDVDDDDVDDDDLYDEHQHGDNGR